MRILGLLIKTRGPAAPGLRVAGCRKNGANQSLAQPSGLATPQSETQRSSGGQCCFPDVSTQKFRSLGVTGPAGARCTRARARAAGLGGAARTRLAWQGSRRAARTRWRLRSELVPSATKKMTSRQRARCDSPGSCQHSSKQSFQWQLKVSLREKCKRTTIRRQADHQRPQSHPGTQLDQGTGPASFPQHRGPSALSGGHAEQLGSALCARAFVADVQRGGDMARDHRLHLDGSNPAPRT